MYSLRHWWNEYVPRKVITQVPGFEEAKDVRVRQRVSCPHQRNGCELVYLLIQMKHC